MIISFYTTTQLSKLMGVEDPLITGIKTVTRRKWNDKYASKFFNLNKWHEARDSSPYVKGSKKLGRIKLSCKPYKEQLIRMPDEDLIKEGNLWTTKEEFYRFIECEPHDLVWVLRFQFEEG